MANILKKENYLSETEFIRDIEVYRTLWKPMVKEQEIPEIYKAACCTSKTTGN